MAANSKQTCSINSKGKKMFDKDKVIGATDMLMYAAFNIRMKVITSIFILIFTIPSCLIFCRVTFINIKHLLIFY